MYIPPLPIVLSVYCITGYLNAFVTVNEVDPEAFKEPLYDHLHNALPQIPFIIPNTLLVLSVIYFLLRLRLKHVKKVLWMISLIFLIRLFTFSITIDPPAVPKCQSRASDQPLHWNVLKIIFGTSDNTCLDLNFSGHAVYMTMCFLSILKFSNYNAEKLLFGLFYLVSVLSIIAARMHYSSDVIIGVTIASLFYSKFY